MREFRQKKMIKNQLIFGSKILVYLLTISLLIVSFIRGTSFRYLMTVYYNGPSMRETFKMFLCHTERPLLTTYQSLLRNINCMMWYRGAFFVAYCGTVLLQPKSRIVECCGIFERIALILNQMIIDQLNDSSQMGEKRGQGVKEVARNK